MPEFGEAEMTAVGEAPSPVAEEDEKPLDVTAFSEQITHIEPIEIVWKDITLDVKLPGRIGHKRETKRILEGISGYAKPGELLAIMGSTGAGKTSLLNVLARRAEGVSTGVVLVNGKPLGSSMKFAGYVAQDDAAYASLTVRETLTLSALLRLPREMTKEEKLARAESVIAELGLQDAADTRVGNDRSRGLSGGERRRLSIGEVLIPDPSLIFLDEPTSGLDAATAQSVVDTLRMLALHGRTVVCTIHQPRSNIFTKFDRLMLLCQGKVVYFGNANTGVDYFQGLKPTPYKCPPYTNPADFFLDLITIVGRKDKDTAVSRIEYLKSSYVEPPEIRESIVNAKPDTADGTIAKHKFEASWGLQFALLSQRSARNIIREPLTSLVRAVQSVVMAVVTGLIFLRLGYSFTDVQNRTGVLFFMMMFYSFNSMTSVLATFPLEKRIVVKERAASTYNLSAYFMGKNLSEMPLDILFVLLYGSIAYWMVGLNPLFVRFVIYCCVTSLVAVAAVSLGLLVSASSPTVTVANIVAPLLLVLLMLFAGFYINASNIPVYLIWIQYLSYIKYGFEALIVNEFTGEVFSCSPSQQLPGGICPVTTGEKVISNLGMSSVNIGANCGILIALIFGFRFFAYVALRMTTRSRVNRVRLAKDSDLALTEGAADAHKFRPFEPPVMPSQNEEQIVVEQLGDAVRV